MPCVMDILVNEGMGAEFRMEKSDLEKGLQFRESREVKTKN